ncbi:hypothetical protein K190097F3_04040 [Enterocloster clostridioformis]|uniref:Uncharacterized protein n=1 Tax=[Clostridium] clostridioforme 90A8 TaxID=999408 RepID=A0A0E2HAG8_9FIRM|nr:hypothetical protein [Enterocloster clostridioformis]ENZ14057.1 hypothetical protein HMPREF1090_02349 [[Clostridium] clostridioforme 90A8]
MSAGICIMNKHAVAMAADSAVTIGQHVAIHNSANKLFALSRCEPVGVIVYANASFMQIPIEIIIKQYKAFLGSKAFESLEEYVSDFIGYIENNPSLFRFEKTEELYIQNVYVDLFKGMVGDRKQYIDKKLSEVSRELTEDELSEISEKTFNATCNFIEAQKKIPDFSFSAYIEEKYCNSIKEHINNNFSWLTNDQSATLAKKVCQLFDSDFFRNGFVGMSFAGYGKSEIFPQMIHLELGGIINSKLRYLKKEHVSIDESNDASITPLAQTDVMQTFLFGINDGFLQKIATEVPRQIIRKMADIDNNNFADGKKNAVIKELNTSTKNIINEIVKKANEEYMQPILQSVSTLPIEELSLFAESMINITSVRRKVALDGNIGTVGGPIDVAIISKHDGFIWMKRKHYFDIKYNPQYLYTHYNSDAKKEVDYENADK